MHKIDSVLIDDKYYKMVIHVQCDSGFQRYQKLMRLNPALWPLYRGFFVDINLFKANNERAAEIMKHNNGSVDHGSDSYATSDAHALPDEDANLMMKLKFLTYKLRTFLIRNGLTKLFGKGPAEYKAYYMRQMKIWGVSAEKQKEMSKMLDEWAVYILNKYEKERLSSNTYLSEAEPFIEEYAKRSAANQALVGSAGNFVRSEDFIAIVDGLDEEGDLDREQVRNIPQGLIVFFPGIPGCAKSALCKELLNNPGNFGDDRSVQTLMGDLIKVPYWPKIAEERRKKPHSIMLADKNAPNEEVWKQIEVMCRSSKSLAVPVVPDSEGTDSNPFSLDALAIFMCRVLQRANHPGKLDKASPNAGYVLLMFYHLYEGKNRREFEGELIQRFGSLVKMPLLKSDKNPLPDAVKSVLQEGIDLYKLHFKRHRRLDSSKGTYVNEWAKWEKLMRDTISSHAKYLNSIQEPFELAVSKVLEQLKSIAKGEFTEPCTKSRKLGSSIIYAAITLPVDEILNALNNISRKKSKVKAFLKDKLVQETLRTAHVTLAHKRIHGVTDYEQLVGQKVDVELTALLFSDKMAAAIEVRVGSVEGREVICKNEWPHVTVWTEEGVAAKQANKLHSLHLQGNATRVKIRPPIVVQGQVDLF